MGAINYGSNNILLNLGVETNYYPDKEEIEAYRKDFDENDLSDEEIENFFMDDYYLWLEMEFKDIEKSIPDNLEFYEITLESGYYEGYYLKIKDVYSWLDCWEEKALMNKELTRIKKFLLNCILNHGFVVYRAGWCTAYESQSKSIELLNKAISQERDRIKRLYTDKQVCKMSVSERKEKFGILW